LQEIFDREAQEESDGEGGAHLPDQRNPPLHNRQGLIVIDDDNDDDDNEPAAPIRGDRQLMLDPPVGIYLARVAYKYRQTPD